MDKKYQIGNFITECRENKKMTQSKLGELLGVSNKAVSKWENGKSLPNTKIMTKLCEVLDVSIEELLEGKRFEIQKEKVNLTEFEHVFKYYNNDSRIEIGLYDISLSFNLGEIVAICGVSGSGKTTLIKAIGGLDTIESGEIYLQKEGISRYDEIDFEEYRKSYISYIFQDYGILENYTILDNLLIIRLLMGDDYKTAFNKANDILKEINLYNYRNKKANKLSGGQKQKLAIARAVIKDSPILLGDEITANLDHKQAKDVLKTLMKHAKNKLIILVTHDFNQIQEYVTRRISLDDGRIVEDVILKDSEKQSIKLEKKRIKEKKSLPFILSYKYFKSNFLKFIIMFLVILIGSFTMLGTNYACDLGYEKLKTVSDNERYPSDMLEIFNKNGFSREEIKELHNKDGINKLQLVSRKYNFSYSLYCDMNLKNNEIKVPNDKNTDYFNANLLGMGKIKILGDYIINADKNDNGYYVSFDNYIMVHKYVTNLALANFFVEKKVGKVIEKDALIVDLNYHEEKIKISNDDNDNVDKVVYNDIALNYDFSEELKYNEAYISPDYLSSLLEAFDKIGYNFLIEYDLDSLESLIEYFKQKGFNYMNNDYLEDNLQTSEMLFVLECLFIALSIVPFLILTLVINKTLSVFLKNRKNEFILLRKIGFSKNTIIKSALIPIILTLVVGNVFTVLCACVFRFNLLDLCLLLLLEELLYSYKLINNLKQKAEKIIEGKE